MLSGCLAQTIRITPSLKHRNIYFCLSGAIKLHPTPVEWSGDLQSFSLFVTLAIDDSRPWVYSVASPARMVAWT